MGAAAVFETAAEIPPTIDKRLVAVSTRKKKYASRLYRSQGSIAPVFDRDCVARQDVLKKSTTKPCTHVSIGAIIAAKRLHS